MLKRFGVEITEKEKEMVLECFPGRDEGEHKRVNIGRLYDQKYQAMLAKIYQKVDVHENDVEDDPVD